MKSLHGIPRKRNRRTSPCSNDPQRTPRRCKLFRRRVRRCATYFCHGRALPRRPLSEQTESALQALQTIFREEADAGAIVMQSVFLKNMGDQAACRQMIEAFYGHDLPPTSYISQPPCDGKLLAIEAWGLGGGSGALHVE